MSKTKGKVAPAAIPLPVIFPKSLLAVFNDHGGVDQFLATGETPADLEHVDKPTVTVARYVLIGTGVIERNAPVYVEHAAA